MGGVQEFNPKVVENVKATEERFVVLFVRFLERLGYDLGGRKHEKSDIAWMSF